MLLQMALFNSFLLLSNIPLYKYTTSSLFYLKNFYLFILFFFFGCTESSLLQWPSPVSESWGYSLVAAHGFHCSGFSCCGARALGHAGFSMWHTASVAPQHVESSWARDRTHVPCIGRWILNQCTTREVLPFLYPFTCPWTFRLLPCLGYCR